MAIDGAVIYHGPSHLGDHGTVAVVLTGLRRPTSNPKTGPMIQAWILDASRDPLTAVESGSDSRICGACPLRGTDGGRGRRCYVVPVQAPNSVFKRYIRGGYPYITPRDARRLVAGRPIRLGAYGDPAAVPTRVWTDLLRGTDRWTGYTHQWRDCDPALQRILMASVDSVADAYHARAAGWRTFRILQPTEPTDRAIEFTCPASAEQGKRSTCAQCSQCSGTDGRGIKSVTIAGHGPMTIRRVA